jgi:inner membrane protein
MRWQAHAASPGLREELQAIPSAQELARFTHGFYKVHEQGGRAWITDLRMGQEPHYVFSFLVAQRGSAWHPVVPDNQGTRGDTGEALAWLWRRMLGEDVPPPGTAP